MSLKPELPFSLDEALAAAKDFGVDNVIGLKWLPGGVGSASQPLPVISTQRERFVLKHLKAAKTRDDAYFVMDFVSYLLNKGVPIPAVHRMGSNGLHAENFIAEVGDSQDTLRYYSLERWVEGRDISRKDASPPSLIAAGEMIGHIHNSSSDFVPKYPNTSRYSIEKSIQLLSANPSGAWRSKISAHIDSSELTEVEGHISEVLEFWTPEWLEQMPKRAIHSDLNFGNLKFNDTGDEVIAVFDWDYSRLGRPLEDFFAVIAGTGRGAEPLYMQSVRQDLDTIRIGYHQSVPNHLGFGKELEMALKIRLLNHLALTVSKIGGSTKNDPNLQQGIHDDISYLNRVTGAFQHKSGY